MKAGPDIARAGALIGEPARANMLTALLSGKALTVSELAGEAGVTIATASGHLAKLEAGGFVTPRKQGRHKYFSLASDEVARALEALTGLAAEAGHLRTRTGPRDTALRTARVCYNHLAGEMGVAMFQSLAGRGFIGVDEDGLAASPDGLAFAASLGVDVPALSAGRTPVCRECLDWSERRSHLAGTLGRALLTRIYDLAWARRQEGTRVVVFSPKGRAEFARHFPLPERDAQAA